MRRVLEIAAGEAPVFRVFQVPGRTASVSFMSLGRDALIKALMATGRFCIAYSTGASQHPGETTLREICGSDSLHVSIGPGDRFDAHIDKYSPVTEHPGSSFCPNLPAVAAVTHIGREVVPEWIRKKTGIPAVQVFPEPSPTFPRSEPTPRQEADSPPVVGIKWRFWQTARRCRAHGLPPGEGDPAQRTASRTSLKARCVLLADSRFRGRNIVYVVDGRGLGVHTLWRARVASRSKYLGCLSLYNFGINADSLKKGASRTGASVPSKEKAKLA